MQLDLNHFYIAEIGVGTKEFIERHTIPMVVCGAPFKAIEVYDTPFDAVRALNKTTKLMPEHHVTIYQAIETCNTVTISNNSESRLLALADMKFEKYQVMALGSLVYSL